MARIRNRISLAFTVLLALALFAGALFSLQSLETAQMKRLQDSLMEHAKLVAVQSETISATDMPVLVQRSARALNRYVFVVRENGQTLAAAAPSGQGLNWPANIPVPAESMTFEHSLSGEDMLFATVVVADGRGDHSIAVVAAPLAPEYVSLLQQWKWLAGEFALLCLLLLGIGYWLARRIAAPLEHIASTTEQIADGDLRKRVPYWGQDEYGKISSAINSLTVKLLDQMDDLSQERSKVEGIIAQMGSGVLVVDRSGVIVVANEAAAHILDIEYGNGALVGRTHWEAANSLRISESIDTVLLKGSPQRKEISIGHAHEINVELYATPIWGRNEEVVGAVTVLHDVTQFRRVERMRTEFVANVSHELRTPITAVKGFAETLLDGALEDPDLRRQFVQIIYDESERLSHLVIDLLELSKIESGHSVFTFSDTDLCELVRTSADRLQNQAAQAGLEIILHTPDVPVVAELAPWRITQVLINLVGNAIAYTASPGRIDITVEDGEREVSIAVADTGIGIPEQDVPRIFERFYRVDKDRSRHTGGTGLGLAIVKHIVEAHHGRIRVKSAVGQGSTFTVVLPKHQTRKATEEPSDH